LACDDTNETIGSMIMSIKYEPSYEKGAGLGHHRVLLRWILWKYLLNLVGFRDF